ncbi:hypothetical protein Hanom_Chr13g01239191 [Helianthus anomalus]
MTIKNWLTRARGFRSCIRVRRCGHARVQPNPNSETHFCNPVGLVVKHVIKLQWSSKDFTL